MCVQCERSNSSFVVVTSLLFIMSYVVVMSAAASAAYKHHTITLLLPPNIKERLCALLAILGSLRVWLDHPLLRTIQRRFQWLSGKLEASVSMRPASAYVDRKRIPDHVSNAEMKVDGRPKTATPLRRRREMQKKDKEEEERRRSASLDGGGVMDQHAHVFFGMHAVHWNSKALFAGGCCNFLF